MANIYLNNAANVGHPRSCFTGSPKHATSHNFGQCYPVFAKVMQPGDTLELDLDARIRGATPIAPVMGDSYMNYYAFWCPWRLVFTKTKEYFGENDSTAWTLQNPVNKPKVLLQIPDRILDNDSALSGANKHNYWHAGTDLNFKIEDSDLMMPNKLASYLGFNPGLNEVDILAGEAETMPPGHTGPVWQWNFSALKFRTYWEIWNNYFRDENYIAPITFYKSTITQDPRQITLPYDHYRYNPTTQGYCSTKDNGSDILFACKAHDMFTTLLPEPQKANNINLLDLSPLAPVGAFTAEEHGLAQQPTKIKQRGTGGVNGLAFNGGLAAYGAATLQNITDPTVVSVGGAAQFTNLYAKLPEAGAITIQSIRNAAAYTQYYEALARGGSRYQEYIHSIFGVTPAGETIQIPEILGVHKQVITQTPVPQTSGETTANGTTLGDVGALSFSVHKKGNFIKKAFSEWGIVMIIAVPRIERIHSFAIDPEDEIYDAIDEYAPQFDHVGDQPVKASRIDMRYSCTSMQGNAYYKDFTFGYQEAFDYKRFIPNQCSGIVSKGNFNSLDYWTYGTGHFNNPNGGTQVITPGPTWQLAMEDEVIVDNTLQLGKQASGYGQQLTALYQFNIKLYRVMSIRSIPGMTRI